MNEEKSEPTLFELAVQAGMEAGVWDIPPEDPWWNADIGNWETRIPDPANSRSQTADLDSACASGNPPPW